jgi:hypothetical protein
MVTPREMLRDYITVLNILLQNPQVDFDTVIKSQGDSDDEARKGNGAPSKRTISAEDISF